MGDTGLILSNYGLRILDQLRRDARGAPTAFDGIHARLDELRQAVVLPFDHASCHRELIDRGLAQTDPHPDRPGVELRYRRNPLEHVSRVVFQYTTACNFRCRHCRNGSDAPVTEGEPDALAWAADLLVPAGVLRFDFIGGEVTRFGAGWLNVVRRIRRFPGTVVSVLTNGWFLERRDFGAAGQQYPDDRAYLGALADAGVTHVTFSLDGPAAAHDRNRRTPGLYDRIASGMAKVRAAGLAPQVSLVLDLPARSFDEVEWLAQVADLLYTSGSDRLPLEKASRLVRDEMNYASHFVDVGRGVALRQGLQPNAEIPDRLLRCKNFYRPRPSMRIQASGEVSFCPLVDAGEGYGSIHGPGGLLRVLNGLQEAVPYKLHAENRLSAFRRLLDRQLFGERLDHLCSLRAAVTMLARRMLELGVRENDTDVRAVNLDVARRLGLPGRPGL